MEDKIYSDSSLPQGSQVPESESRLDPSSDAAEMSSPGASEINASQSTPTDSAHASFSIGIAPNSELLNILRSKTSLEACCKDIRQWLGNKVKAQFSVEEEAVFKSLVAKERTRFLGRWEKANRTLVRFENQNETWLNGVFNIPKALLNESPTPKLPVSAPAAELVGESVADSVADSGSKKAGRPSLEYECSSERNKRKKNADLAKLLIDQPATKILKSTEMALKQQGEKDLAFILKEAQQSPTRPSKIKKLITARTVTPMTPKEALAYMLDANLTKSMYEKTRAISIKHGSSVFPSYKLVQKAKLLCRPSEPAMISDTAASVSLQSFLEHTCKRILQLQQNSLIDYAKLYSKTELNLKLSCSWGFDGSTGQSQYKQKFARADDADPSDASLFVTTVIPLQLTSEQGHHLWTNEAAQSIRSCRPLRIQFIKETDAVILAEKELVEQQIRTLEDIVVNVENILMIIKFQLYLTVIDGKVLSIITGATSYQNCPLCRATPKQMNDIHNQAFVPRDATSLHYGISPLHAWIRFLEFCLHLGYRNVDSLRQWRVTGGKKNSKFTERKYEIQKLIRQKLDLRVDLPQPGGAGNTNDGNTARRVFAPKNQAIFAECLGVEKLLIEDLHIILCVISSSSPINAVKFGQFCKNLATRYVASYGWYYMPCTLHKILMHGEDSVKNSALPLGMLSEQAGESRNKHYRRDREIHARKTSRKDNLFDVFNRAMDTSDPVLADSDKKSRRSRCKKLQLPQKAIDLMQEPEELTIDRVCEDHPEDDVTDEGEDFQDDDDDNENFFDILGNVNLEQDIQSEEDDD